MSMSRIMVCACVAIILTLPAAGQLSLPGDVEATCAVGPAEFASWFESGSPSANGAVKAADSVAFPTDNTVCDFYKWGAQMFLWLTSPNATGLVLDSTAIFNVLPASAEGQRYLQSNSNDPIPTFALRSEKFDEIGEVGQAGSNGVLMSQKKSLVYYGVHVNDVYAYFLTGQKGGSLTETVFPRNAQDLSEVTLYVRNVFPNVTLQAPETLAMELKTSWVDAATVPDAGEFVTMQATVPAYTANSDNTAWTVNGTQTLTLALVGVHIVGTVQNHPEFVWITYEHILNAPDAAYYYLNSAGQVVQQPYDSSGTFLFMQTGGSQQGANTECMKSQGNMIVVNRSQSNGQPVCQGGIVPSNTVRTYPWGSQANSQDSKVVSNNTELLSINNSIRTQLSQGDLRANYLQVGGIWTSAPSATADAPIPKTADYAVSDLRGSLAAFNATMETYVQGSDCFSCHNQSKTAPNSFQPFELSHIYSQIVPLPSGGQ